MKKFWPFTSTKNKRKRRPKNSLAKVSHQPNIIQRLGGWIFERDEPRNVFETPNAIGQEIGFSLSRTFPSNVGQIVTLEDVYVGDDFDAGNAKDSEGEILFSDNYITIVQAAVRYGLPEEYLRKLCRDEILEATKYRQRWYIEEISLIDFISHTGDD